MTMSLLSSAKLKKAQIWKAQLAMTSITFFNGFIFSSF